MIHIQNVIKHAAKSKKTGPSDKERTFTCLGCYAVNPWTWTLSIWQKISLHGGGAWYQIYGVPLHIMSSCRAEDRTYQFKVLIFTKDQFTKPVNLLPQTTL